MCGLKHIVLMFGGSIFLLLIVACTGNSGTRHNDAITTVEHTKQPREAVPQKDFIKIIDTLIHNNKITVNWYESGRIEVHKNDKADTIHWFSYGDFAHERNHGHLLLPAGKKPVKLIVTHFYILFTVEDFKGRAALFRVNILEGGAIKFAVGADGCINPIIRECPYIYVDADNNLIVNNGGNAINSDGNISDHISIFEYTIGTKCNKEKKTYLLPRKAGTDMDMLKDAIDFYAKEYSYK